MGVKTILIRQLRNPLLVILLIATLTSFFLGQKIDAFVIGSMMFLSVGLGFWNEYQAEKTVKDLLSKIPLTATVVRNGVKKIVPVSEVIKGDIILLASGSILPADMQIISSEGLEVNESILTGESFPVIKNDKDNNAFAGTTVLSGSGTGVVTAIGKNTKLGEISLDASAARPQTEFEKGLSSFGSLLVKVVAIMSVVIFIGNWLVGHSPVGSILFALTIAIGLTPELLPVIVTVSLAHGARKLAKKKVIVKQLVAIENLGNMEVLCTDKTGTLTEGKIKLTKYCNANGEEDPKVLTLALLCNAAVVHAKVVGDAIDSAIWNFARENDIKLPSGYIKIEEEPFNYEARAMFSVYAHNEQRVYLYKGSPASVIDACNLTIKKKKELQDMFSSIAKEGVRAVAVASQVIGKKDNYSLSDAKNLKFEGYLTFLDTPKKNIGQALALLAKLKVSLKIVTGDNEFVTMKISREIGAPSKKILTGPDIEEMSNEQLEAVVWSTDIFARVTPKQKAKIIRALNTGNHTVGYLGDGVNDALALHEADIGISVDTAVDVAKDTASIVLLQKNLEIIAEGIRDGRTTFYNTIKYVLMGTSSNFGNMFSAAGASFILPFLPMTPSQVLLTNLLYDISQLSIPTDNVDDEELRRPNGWDLSLIRRYMLFFGPVSSIYDFMTFGVMYFIFQARNSLFQTGWFVESLITQTLVIFVIRTKRIPFWKSKPSRQMVLTMFLVVGVGLLLPYLPLNKYLSFTPLPALYFLILVVMTVTYLGLVEIGKAFLNRREK